MRRFYVPPAESRGDVLLLRDREAHHAVDVLRLQPGEEVTVLNGAGERLLCEARRVTRKQVELAVRRREHIPKPAFELTLFQAIVKGKTMETIIEKATELGISRVVPLLTERVVSHLDSERAESKQAKWEVTAVESIKQCGSPWLPKIEAPQKLGDVLKSLPRFDLACVASLRGGNHPRHWLQQSKQPRTGCVWIGPEGDFTDAELDAIEGTGAKPITLGPLVLRADTAAIASLAILRAEVDRLSVTERAL
jgi:16S rRNA (uracil1498-N3)-methyltransferase